MAQFSVKIMRLTGSLLGENQQHLVQRGHQVILLSTNTEVVGEYLEEIEQNVQKKFLISFERVGDTGESSVREGYFAGQEARK